MEPVLLEKLASHLVYRVLSFIGEQGKSLPSMLRNLRISWGPQEERSSPEPVGMGDESGG